MALIGPPIPVADATSVLFDFRNYQRSVNAQVRFYTDLAGLVPLSPTGTGSRDITTTNTSSGYEGAFSNPVELPTVSPFVSTIENGVIAAAVDGQWYEILLGGGMQNVTLSSAAVVTPGTAVSYRLIVDSNGDSRLA